MKTLLIPLALSVGLAVVTTGQAQTWRAPYRPMPNSTCAAIRLSTFPTQPIVRSYVAPRRYSTPIYTSRNFIATGRDTFTRILPSPPRTTTTPRIIYPSAPQAAHCGVSYRSAPYTYAPVYQPMTYRHAGSSSEPIRHASSIRGAPIHSTVVESSAVDQPIEAHPPLSIDSESAVAPASTPVNSADQTQTKSQGDEATSETANATPDQAATENSGSFSVLEKSGGSSDKED